MHPTDPNHPSNPGFNPGEEGNQENRRITHNGGIPGAGSQNMAGMSIKVVPSGPQLLNPATGGLGSTGLAAGGLGSQTPGSIMAPKPSPSALNLPNHIPSQLPSGRFGSFFVGGSSQVQRSSGRLTSTASDLDRDNSVTPRRHAEVNLEALEDMRRVVVESSFYPDAVQQFRAVIYYTFETPEYSLLSRFIQFAILGCISSSVALLVIESLPSTYHLAGTFQRLELSFTIVFTIEFALRLWVCDVFGNQTRKSFMKTPMNLLDFFAILPLYAESLVSGFMDINFLKVLRVTRLIRLFRLMRMGPFHIGVQLIFATIRESVRTLAVLFLILSFWIVFFAAAIYYVERWSCPSDILEDYSHYLIGRNIPAGVGPTGITPGKTANRQPSYVEECRGIVPQGYLPKSSSYGEKLCCVVFGVDSEAIWHDYYQAFVSAAELGHPPPYHYDVLDSLKDKYMNENLSKGNYGAKGFESIFQSLWWSLVTVTSVGYGDYVPQTQAGKVVGMAVMIAGILILSLPVGIVGSKFHDAYNVYDRDPPVLKYAVVKFRSWEKRRDRNEADISRAISNREKITQLLISSLQAVEEEDFRKSVIPEYPLSSALNTSPKSSIAHGMGGANQSFLGRSGLLSGNLDVTNRGGANLPGQPISGNSPKDLNDWSKREPLYSKSKSKEKDPTYTMSFSPVTITPVASPSAGGSKHFEGESKTAFAGEEPAFTGGKDDPKTALIDLPAGSGGKTASIDPESGWGNLSSGIFPIESAGRNHSSARETPGSGVEVAAGSSGGATTVGGTTPFQRRVEFETEVNERHCEGEVNAVNSQKHLDAEVHTGFANTVDSQKHFEGSARAAFTVTTPEGVHGDATIGGDGGGEGWTVPIRPSSIENPANADSLLKVRHVGPDAIRNGLIGPEYIREYGLANVPHFEDDDPLLLLPAERCKEMLLKLLVRLSEQQLERKKAKDSKKKMKQFASKPNLLRAGTTNMKTVGTSQFAPSSPSAIGVNTMGAHGGSPPGVVNATIGAAGNTTLGGAHTSPAVGLSPGSPGGGTGRSIRNKGPQLNRVDENRANAFKSIGFKPLDEKEREEQEKEQARQKLIMNALQREETLLTSLRAGVVPRGLLFPKVGAATFHELRADNLKKIANGGFLAQVLRQREEVEQKNNWRHFKEIPIRDFEVIITNIRAVMEYQKELDEKHAEMVRVQNDIDINLIAVLQEMLFEEHATRGSFVDGQSQALEGKIQSPGDSETGSQH